MGSLSQGIKGRKNIVCIFFSSLRLVMESRNMDPDNFLMETSLRLLLAPFSPLEGLKGHLFCVTNLSPVHVQATGRGWLMRG